MIKIFFNSYFNIIGIMGVVLVLMAYFFLQINKLNQSAFLYSLLNFFGSVLILISLCYTWNLASGIIEICWLLISLFGCSKAIFLKYKMRNTLKT